MKLFKKMMSVVLSALICVGTVMPAFAIEYNAADGTVHVDGNQSWQDNHEIYNNDNRYDHTAEDNEVTITGETDKTVLEVTDKESDVNVTLDGVKADVEEGPAANIQGGSVTITNSELSTSDSSSAAVEIGGDADVKVEGTGVEDMTSVNGSGTGIHIQDNGSLTVESGILDVNGSAAVVTPDSEPNEDGVVVVPGGSTGIDLDDNASLNVGEGATLGATGAYVNVDGSKDFDVTVEGGSTGIDASGSSTVNIEGKAEVTGAFVQAASGNQSNVTVQQDGNVGMSVSDSSKIVVDGGDLDVLDVNAPLNGFYTTNVQSGWGSAWSLNRDDLHMKTSGGEYVPVEELIAEGKIFLRSYDSNTKTYVYTAIDAAASQSTSSLYIQTGENADGTPIYNKLGTVYYPRYSTKKNYLKHQTEGEGMGLVMDGQAAVNVSNKGDLSVAGDKAAAELNGESVITVGEDGTMYVACGAAVVIDETSKLSSFGTIYGTLIENIKKGDVSGYDAIDFHGTGLHYVGHEIPDDWWRPSTLYIYWDIGEEYEGKTLEFNLTELIQRARELCGYDYRLQPSDAQTFQFIITNNSGHSFTYNENSLDIDRPNIDQLIDKGIEYWPARAENLALRALVNPSLDPTTEDGHWELLYGRAKKLSPNQMPGIENYLKTEGYNGKTFDSLGEYYLYFANMMNGTDYKALTDVPTENLQCIFGGDGTWQDGMMTTTEDGYQSLLAQAAETGSFAVEVIKELPDGRRQVRLREVGDVREAGVNYFYQQSFEFAYGEAPTPDEIDGDPIHVDDYHKNNALADSEKFMADKLGVLNAKDDPEGKNVAKFGAYFEVDGRNTANTFLRYAALWNSPVTLSRTDPDPTPTPSNSPDPTPTPSNTPEPTPTPSNSPEPTPTPSNTPEPTPTPTPEVEIPDPTPPLSEDPEEPEVDIPEPDVPLAETPSEEVEMEDPDVPLADVPQTGDISPLWYVAAIVSAMSLTAILLTKIREDRETER